MQTRQHVPGKHREQQKPISNPTFNKFLYIRQATHLEDVSPMGSIIISYRVGVVGNLSCASSNARFQSLECTVNKREETIQNSTVPVSTYAWVMFFSHTHRTPIQITPSLAPWDVQFGVHMNSYAMTCTGLVKSLAD